MKFVLTYNCSHKQRNTGLKRININSKRKKTYTPKIDLYCFKESFKKVLKNNLLDFISNKSKKNIDNLKFGKENLNKNEIFIDIPENFSLITNPSESLDVINKLSYLYINRENIQTNKIVFNYEKTKEIELSILILKNVICLSLNKVGFVFSGNIPKDCDQKSIGLFFFSGLMDAMAMDPKEFLNFKRKPHRFPLFGGGNNKPEISCLKMSIGGETETKVAEWFNECLKRNGYELKRSGLKKIDNILGEIFTNCRDHSGEEINQYYCRGHYHHGEDNIGKVSIAIFNFGQTIHEGFKNSTKIPSDIEERITELIRKHKSKFGFIKNWDEESLITLYSLQNEISSVFDEETTRGTGTIKFIKCFMELGQSLNEGLVPKLSIISGNTQILITNSSLCEISKEKGITFNKDKTLDKEPSKDHVKKINSYFPGTMISLDIYLDREFIEEVRNNG